jgi:hypothetical protein
MSSSTLWDVLSELVTISFQPFPSHFPRIVHDHPPTLSTSTMECTACEKPATLVCGDCNGSPILEGDPPIAYYCNSVCQETHWTHHEPTCRRLQDRKALYMVGEMAQRLFYIHRDITWKSLDIGKVEKVGNNLIIRERVIFWSCLHLMIFGPVCLPSVLICRWQPY